MKQKNYSLFLSDFFFWHWNHFFSYLFDQKTWVKVRMEKIFELWAFRDYMDAQLFFCLDSFLSDFWGGCWGCCLLLGWLSDFKIQVFAFCFAHLVFLFLRDIFWYTTRLRTIDIYILTISICFRDFNTFPIKKSP